MERRAERRLIKDYEADMRDVLSNANRDVEVAIELAKLPLSIRGFGPVKAVKAEKAEVKRQSLKSRLQEAEPGDVLPMAG